MPPDTVLARLIRRQLDAGIAELEGSASHGNYGTMSIRATGNAARVLGHADIADRAIRLLQAAPDDAFWAGAITNIPLPAKAPPGLRTLEETAALEKRHPLFSAEKLISAIRSSEDSNEHLLLCLQGRYQEARELAGSGRELEEVGGTLAVLGQFDEARRVANDPALEGVRQQGVHFAIMIELFRYGHMEEACALLAERESKRPDASGSADLALAIGGREPWLGYPYPDW